MRTSINNQYFCFPLEVAGKFVTEIEGRADLDVNTGSCAIIDMTGIEIKTLNDGYVPLGNSPIEIALIVAIRAFYIDGAGHDLLENSIDWHVAESDARIGAAEERRDFYNER